MLAVAYKVNGKPVPRRDATQNMAAENNRVRALFNHICESGGPNSYNHFRSEIEKVKGHLDADRYTLKTENQQPLLPNSPIVRAYGGPEDTVQSSMEIWYDYHISVEEDQHSGRDMLNIRAKADHVVSVDWRNPGEQAEVKLAATPTRFFVAPLKPCSEAQQDDEICVGDLVLLVGRYLIVATPQENDYGRPFIMTNYLEIQDAQSVETRRRGRNFQARDEYPVTRFI